MFVLPGRKMLRPPMMTDGKDKADCTKKHYTSRPNMTRFIILKCCCRHPKIIGFTLIKEVESIAMAISTIISFLPYPPRTTWYDNACNMYDSALIRVPWLLRSTFLLVDRLHYQGHTCCNHYNPNRYQLVARQRSQAAEIMTAVLDKSAGFIRYLKGRNIKPYLRIMFALHNFTSVMKDKLNRNELPWLDMKSLYNERFPCGCFMCQVMGEADTWRHTTLETVSFSRVHTA